MAPRTTAAAEVRQLYTAWMALNSAMTSQCSGIALSSAHADCRGLKTCIEQRHKHGQVQSKHAL